MNADSVFTSTDYNYHDASCNHSHKYLLPCIDKILDQKNIKAGTKIFDLGCGNGSVGAWLQQAKGLDVTGVDPSVEGVNEAQKAYPDLNINIGSAYDDLQKKYGCFPVVTSLEVVEHVYDPRRYAATLFNLVEEDGFAIISTPYHSYLKNLALALCGKMDDHFTALTDHGHIKFWSRKTLSVLLKEQGFSNIIFYRVGRLPFLAKSMIAVAHKKGDF